MKNNLLVKDFSTRQAAFVLVVLFLVVLPLLNYLESI